MKDYLNEINDLFPMRRRAEEKSRFYDYIVGELGENRVQKETLENKHNNIIIGDVSEAKVIFTAHYDTPAASIIPNIMLPGNKVIGTIIHMLFPIAMALFSLLVAYLVGGALQLDQSEIMLIYLVLYVALFFGSTRLIPNKNNKNDNTSGVATVLSLASEASDSKAAFVLFDNEEKGLLGSKAFSKKHKEILKNKMVINFDCVGNGDQMIFIAKQEAEKLPEYETLKAIVLPNEDFEVHHLPFKKSLGNSDHKSFPCGVGVMASRKGRVIKFFTGRIHTTRDIVADIKNILFLKDKIKQFVEML